MERSLEQGFRGWCRLSWLVVACLGLAAGLASTSCGGQDGWSGLASSASEALASPGSEYGRPGPYAAGFTILRFVDGSRNPELGGRPIPAFVWYPVNRGDIRPSSPDAVYPLDPLYASYPDATSALFARYGADRAFQDARPSRKGPFPLVVFSPGWGADATFQVFVGARLASHGFVVAVLTHAGDCIAWYDSCEVESVSMFERPLDISYALTGLLAENDSPTSRLHRLVDARHVAAAGHSLGGYAAMVLAAGDDSVCDSIAEVLEEEEPPFTCAASVVDPRVKAVLHFEGMSNWALKFSELARVEVPAMGIGRSYDWLYSYDRDYGARWQAAVESQHTKHHPAAYRVDVDHTYHRLFQNMCATIRVYGDVGMIPPEDMQDYIDYYCPSPPYLDEAESLRIATEYSIAFLKVALADEDRAERVLTQDWTRAHEPEVNFFPTERGGNLHAGPGTAWLPPSWMDEYDYYDYMPVDDEGHDCRR